jgi:branched-chain amino acid transport system ATP-binding protein
VSAALELHDLRRSFGGIHAVGGVSLAVERQEIVGLIGPNGSGKSTLFNLVSGVYRPDAGRVLFRGRDVTGWPAYRIARAGMARTFQIPALFLNMTVWDNLLTAAAESDWRRAPQRAEEVLELMTLSHLREDQADSLSGGQQRLLEFGRVLMRDPHLVLLDEVAAGVHPGLRRVILDGVLRLRDQGKTFVVIEHDMELVRAICERIVVMDFGEVVATGTFDEIARNPHVTEAYLGRPVEP